MRSILKKFFVLINVILSFGFLNGEYLAETKNNSIINLFCLESFREEMLKANLIYEDKIAEYTCKCYLEEFIKNTSHQKAIKKCKLETQNKFNL